MTRSITALHTLQGEQIVTALGGLPGPDEWLSKADMLDIARQIHQHAIDAQRIVEAPLRHPATPNYLEFPEPPTFDESCSFEPIGIDSEGGSHD